jgi:hypothetical protein
VLVFFFHLSDWKLLVFALYYILIHSHMAFIDSLSYHLVEDRPMHNHIQKDEVDFITK